MSHSHPIEDEKQQQVEYYTRVQHTYTHMVHSSSQQSLTGSVRGNVASTGSLNNPNISGGSRSTVVLPYLAPAPAPLPPFHAAHTFKAQQKQHQQQQSFLDSSTASSAVRSQVPLPSLNFPTILPPARRSQQQQQQFGASQSVARIPVGHSALVAPYFAAGVAPRPPIHAFNPSMSRRFQTGNMGPNVTQMSTRGPIQHYSKTSHQAHGLPITDEGLWNVRGEVNRPVVDQRGGARINQALTASALAEQQWEAQQRWEFEQAQRELAQRVDDAAAEEASSSIPTVPLTDAQRRQQALDDGSATSVRFQVEGMPAEKIKAELKEYLSHSWKFLRGGNNPNQLTQLTDREIDTLYEEGGAGADTLLFLRSFAAEGLTFPSLSALLEALQKAAQDWAERKKQDWIYAARDDTELATVVEFLRSPECTLFSSAQHIHATDLDLNTLIVEGGGLATCLSHLRAMNAAGRKYSSFTHLLFAIVAAEHQRVTYDQKKQELLAWLNSEQCVLFNGHKKKSNAANRLITMEQLDTLLSYDVLGMASASSFVPTHSLDLTKGLLELLQTHPDYVQRCDRFRFDTITGWKELSEEVWKTREALKSLIVGPESVLIVDTSLPGFNHGFNYLPAGVSASTQPSYELLDHDLALLLEHATGNHIDIFLHLKHCGPNYSNVKFDIGPASSGSASLTFAGDLSGSFDDGDPSSPTGSGASGKRNISGAIEALASFIRTKHENYLHLKQNVWEWMNGADITNFDVVEVDPSAAPSGTVVKHHSPLVSSQTSSIHQLPPCKLFSTSSSLAVVQHHKAKIALQLQLDHNPVNANQIAHATLPELFTSAEIDLMFHHVRTYFYTLNYLAAFEMQNLRFDTLAECEQYLLSKFQRDEKKKEEEKLKVYQYLTSRECKLLPFIQSMLYASTMNIVHANAAGSTTTSSHSTNAAQQQLHATAKLNYTANNALISSVELDEILLSVGGGANAFSNESSSSSSSSQSSGVGIADRVIVHLKRMENEAKRFHGGAKYLLKLKQEKEKEQEIVTGQPAASTTAVASKKDSAASAEPLGTGTILDELSPVQELIYSLQVSHALSLRCAEEIYLLLNSPHNPLLKSFASSCSRSDALRLYDEFAVPSQALFVLWLLSCTSPTEQTLDAVQIQVEVKSIDSLLALMQRKYDSLQRSLLIQQERVLQQMNAEADNSNDTADFVGGTTVGKKSSGANSRLPLLIRSPEDTPLAPGLQLTDTTTGEVVEEKVIVVTREQELEIILHAVEAPEPHLSASTTGLSRVGLPAASQKVGPTSGVAFPTTLAAFNILNIILSTFQRQFRSFTSLQDLVAAIRTELDTRKNVQKQVLQFLNHPDTRLFGPQRKAWLAAEHDLDGDLNIATLMKPKLQGSSEEKINVEDVNNPDSTFVPYIHVTKADVEFLYDNSHDASEDLLRYIRDFHEFNVSAIKYEETMKGSVVDQLTKEAADLQALQTANQAPGANATSSTAASKETLTPNFFPTISALTLAVAQAHESFNRTLLATMQLLSPEGRLFNRPAVSASITLPQVKGLLLTEIIPPKATLQSPAPAPGMAIQAPTQSSEDSAPVPIGYESVYQLLRTRHEETPTPQPFATFSQLTDYVKQTWMNKLEAQEKEKVTLARPIIAFLSDPATTLLTAAAFQSSINSKELTNIQVIYNLLYQGSGAKQHTLRHLQMMGCFKFQMKFNAITELAINLREYHRLYEVEKNACLQLLNSISNVNRFWRKDSSKSDAENLQTTRVTMEEVTVLMDDISNLPLVTSQATPVQAYSASSCSSLLRILWKFMVEERCFSGWLDVRTEVFQSIEKHVNEYKKLIAWLTDGSRNHFFQRAFQTAAAEVKESEEQGGLIVPAVLSFQLSSVELNQLIEYSGNSLSNLLFYLQYLHDYGFSVNSVREVQVMDADAPENMNAGIVELLQTVKKLHLEANDKKQELVTVLNRGAHKLFQTAAQFNSVQAPSVGDKPSNSALPSPAAKQPNEMSACRLSPPEIDLLFYESNTGFDCLKYLSDLNLERGGAALIAPDMFTSVLSGSTVSSSSSKGRSSTTATDASHDPQIENWRKNPAPGFSSLSALIVELQRREKIQTAIRSQTYAVLTSHEGRALFDPSAPRVAVDRTKVDALLRSSNTADCGVKSLTCLRQFLSEGRQFFNLYEVATSIKMKHIEELQIYEGGLRSIQDVLNKNANMTLLSNLKTAQNQAAGAAAGKKEFCSEADAEKLFLASGSSANTAIFLLWELNADRSVTVSNFDALVEAVAASREKLDEAKLEVYKFLKSKPAAPLFTEKRAPVESQSNVAGMDQDPAYSYQASITLPMISQMFEQTEAGSSNLLHIGECLKRKYQSKNLAELTTRVAKLHGDFKNQLRQEMAPVVQFLSNVKQCSLWRDDALPKDLDSTHLKQLLEAGQTRLAPIDGWSYKSATLQHLQWMEERNAQVRHHKIAQQDFRQRDQAAITSTEEPYKFTSVASLVPLIAELHSRMVSRLFMLVTESDEGTGQSLLFEPRVNVERSIKVHHMDRLFIEAGLVDNADEKGCHYLLPQLLLLLRREYDPTRFPVFPFHKLLSSVDELIGTLRQSYQKIQLAQSNMRKKLRSWLDVNQEQIFHTRSRELIENAPTRQPAKASATSATKGKKPRHEEKEEKESKEQEYDQEESKEQYPFSRLAIQNTSGTPRNANSSLPIRVVIQESDLDLLLNSCKDIDLNGFMAQVAAHRGEMFSEKDLAEEVERESKYTLVDGFTVPLPSRHSGSSSALVTNPELFSHLDYFLSLHVSAFTSVAELCSAIRARDVMMRNQMRLVYNYLNYNPICSILTNPYSQSKLKIYPGDIITLFEQTQAGIYLLHLLWKFDALPNADGSVGIGSLYFESLPDLITACKFAWLEFQNKKKKDWDKIRTYVNNTRDCFLFSWSDEEDLKLKASGESSIKLAELPSAQENGVSSILPVQRVFVQEHEIGWMLSAASGEDVERNLAKIARSAKAGAAESSAAFLAGIAYQDLDESGGFIRPHFSAASGNETLFHLQSLSENGFKYQRVKPDLLDALGKSHAQLEKVKKQIFLHLRNKTKLFSVPGSTATTLPLTMHQIDRLFEAHGFGLVPLMIAQFEAALGTPLGRTFSSLDDLSSAIHSAKTQIYTYLIGPQCHILMQDIQKSLTSSDAARLLVECTDTTTCLEFLHQIQDESIGHKFASVSLLILELRKKQRDRNEMKKDLLAVLRKLPAPGRLSLFHKNADAKQLHESFTLKHIDQIIRDSEAGERTLIYAVEIEKELNASPEGASKFSHESLQDLANSIQKRHAAYLQKQREDRAAIVAYLTSNIVRSDFILHAGSQIGVGGSSVEVASTNSAQSESSAEAAANAGAGHAAVDLAATTQIGVKSYLPLPRALRCSQLDAAKLLEAVPSHSVSSVLCHVHYLNMDTTESFDYVIPDLAMAVAKMEEDSARAKDEIYEFLKSSKCTFWRVAAVKNVTDASQKERVMPAGLTIQDASDIYEQSEAGPETLFMLWSFNKEKRKIYSVAQLIAELKAAKIASRETSVGKSVEKPRLLAHLTSPSCGLLDQNVDVTSQDLEDLMECTHQSLPELITILDALNVAGSHFASVAELIKGIKDANDAKAEAAKELLRWLTHPDRKLWGTDLDLSTKIRATITETRVENLMQESMTGASGTTAAESDTLFYCRYLETRGFTYESFPELINAIKILHLTRMEMLRKLEALLKSSKFFDNSQTRINIDRTLCEKIDAAVNPSGSGLATTSLAKGGDDSKTDNVVHQTPIDILAITQDLLQMQPQPQFATVEAYIDALKLNALNLSKDEQTAILAFLLNPSCSLFEPGVMDTLVIQLPQVKQLIEEGTAGKHTLNILHYLDETDATSVNNTSSSGESQLDPFRKFRNLPDLAQGIQQAYHLSEEKKHELYSHLSSRKLCTLFSNAPVRPTITMGQVDRLFHESGARNETLAIVQRLDHQLKRKFASITELIPAVRQLHQQTEKQRAVDKKLLYNYLSIPSCGLLHPETLVEDISEDGVAASTTMANHEAILAQLTGKNLALLLREGKGLLNTMAYLQQWDDESQPDQKRSFNAVVELLTALHAAVQTTLDDTYAYLHSQENTLFSHLPDAAAYRQSLTRIDCELLAELGHAGPHLVSVLREMGKAEKRFDSMTELSHAVAQWVKTGGEAAGLEGIEQTRAQMLTGADDTPLSPSSMMVASPDAFAAAAGSPNGVSQSDMMSILNYLQRPDVNLLGAHGTEGVKISRRGLVRLLDAGRTVSGGTLHHLHQLNAQGRQVSSVADLASIVQEQHLESVKLSLDLLTFFSSQQCQLFAGVHGGLELSMGDMAKLLDEGGAGSSTLSYCKLFNQESQQFSSMAELIQAVREAHRKQKRKQDSWLILSYLSGPQCHLLPRTIVQQLSNAPIQRILNSAGGNGQTCLTILKKLESSRRTYESIDALVADVKDGVLHKIPVHVTVRRLPIPADPTGNTRVYVQLFVEDPVSHVFKYVGSSNKYDVLSSTDCEYIDFAAPFYVQQKSHAKDVALKLALYVEHSAVQPSSSATTALGGLHVIGEESSSPQKKLNFDELPATSAHVELVASQSDEQSRMERKIRLDQQALDDAASNRSAQVVKSDAMMSLSFLKSSDGLIGTAIVSLNAYVTMHEPMPVTIMQGNTPLEMPTLLLSPTAVTRKENITPADQQELLQYLSSPQTKLFSDAGWLNVNKDDIKQLIFDGNGIHQTIEMLKQLDMNSEKFQSFEELSKAVAMGLSNPIPIYISCRGLPLLTMDPVVVEVYVRDMRTSLFTFVGSTETSAEGTTSPDFQYSVIVDVFSRKDQEMKLQVMQVDSRTGGGAAAKKLLIGEVHVNNGAFARSPETLELTLSKDTKPLPNGAQILLKHVQIQRVNVSEEDVKFMMSYLANPHQCQLFSTAGWINTDMSSLNWLIQEGQGVHNTVTVLQQLDAAGKKFMTMDQLIRQVARVRQTGRRTPSIQPGLAHSGSSQRLNSPSVHGMIRSASRPGLNSPSPLVIDSNQPPTFTNAAPSPSRFAATPSPKPPSQPRPSTLGRR